MLLVKVNYFYKAIVLVNWNVIRATIRISRIINVGVVIQAAQHVIKRIQIALHALQNSFYKFLHAKVLVIKGFIKT